jgi:hypothetical protein
MLVPTSLVRVEEPAGADVGHAVRFARTGIWMRGETLRELGRALRIRE